MARNKRDGLLFKFALMFTVFGLVTLLMSGANIYYNETAAYKQQCEENMEKIAHALEAMLVADGENFIQYHEVFLKRYKDMRLRVDFSDWHEDKEKFDRMFAARYPGKVMGRDVRAMDLDDETQLAYVTYVHEYWLLTFEKIKAAHGLRYAYYCVPTGELLHMRWVIDDIREEEMIDGAGWLRLAVDVYEPLEEHQKMWEAWNTGRKPQGYDEYDNEYGKTYAYYTPVFVDGKKLGLIGTEVEIAAVNSAILKRAVVQTAGMGLILAACVAALLWFIHRHYIAKLSQLQTNVRVYAEGKNAAIAGTIEKGATGKDEIAALSMQIAAMILELENYMKTLVETTKKLGEAQEHADAMHEMAHKDALTGIRNKAAYDSEIRRVEWELERDRDKRFGVAMIDLNYLKRINDTFGHEQGNIAIKKLCHVVCVIFAHSPVFRIGGDEFVVLLENEDYKNVDALVAKFNETLEEMAKDTTLEPWEQLSAAIGVAYYNPATDSSVTNVFKRADKAMYLRKKAMKAERME